MIAFESWYEQIFSLCGHVCHQQPERSFFLNGLQLPLCARCTGIYAGLIAGAIAGFFPSGSYRMPAILVIGVIGLNALTLVTPFDSNELRYFLGLILGTLCGAVLRRSAADVIHNHESDNRKYTTRRGNR